MHFLVKFFIRNSFLSVSISLIPIHSSSYLYVVFVVFQVSVNVIGFLIFDVLFVVFDCLSLFSFLTHSYTQRKKSNKKIL